MCPPKNLIDIIGGSKLKCNFIGSANPGRRVDVDVDVDVDVVDSFYVLRTYKEHNFLIF